jgi:poly(3-hydroxyalkanoate) synthetase
MNNKPIIDQALDVEEKYQRWFKHPHKTTQESWQSAETEFRKHHHRSWQDVIEQRNGGKNARRSL